MGLIFHIYIYEIMRLCSQMCMYLRSVRRYLCMCTCICTRIRIYTHVYVYTRVCAYIYCYVSWSASMYASVRVLTHVYVYAFVCTSCTHAWVLMGNNICVRVCTHACAFFGLGRTCYAYCFCFRFKWLISVLLGVQGFAKSMRTLP